MYTIYYVRETKCGMIAAFFTYSFEKFHKIQINSNKLSKNSNKLGKIRIKLEQAVSKAS